MLRYTVLNSKIKTAIPKKKTKFYRYLHPEILEFNPHLMNFGMTLNNLIITENWFYEAEYSKGN